MQCILDIKLNNHGISCSWDYSWTNPTINEATTRMVIRWIFNNGDGLTLKGYHPSDGNNNVGGSGDCGMVVGRLDANAPPPQIRMAGGTICCFQGTLLLADTSRYLASVAQYYDDEQRHDHTPPPKTVGAPSPATEEGGCKFRLQN